MSPAWSWTSPSPGATEALGEVLGAHAWGGLVVALEGDLGAGKTCLARGVARGLGVSEDVPIVSPTFTLINAYRGRFNLYHCDLYRLADLEELTIIGFEDLFSEDSVTLVEWADRFPEVLPADRISVQLSFDGEDRRFIRIIGPEQDARVIDLLAAFADHVAGAVGPNGGPAD